MPEQDTPPQGHKNFEAPLEVAADPSLSKGEKTDILEELEQDARQLTIASEEGMTGGEPAALAEVLHAKEALELPPVHIAYELVLKDLETRRVNGAGDTDLISQTILALESIRRSGQ